MTPSGTTEKLKPEQVTPLNSKAALPADVDVDELDDDVLEAMSSDDELAVDNDDVSEEEALEEGELPTAAATPKPTVAPTITAAPQTPQAQPQAKTSSTTVSKHRSDGPVEGSPAVKRHRTDATPAPAGTHWQVGDACMCPLSDGTQVSCVSMVVMVSYHACCCSSEA